METLRILIDGIPPSTNKYIGNSKSHHIYRRDKAEWERKVGAALGGYRPERPYTYAAVSVKYVFPDRRRRDPDNYAGKMLLDPLVRFGVLADDSFAVVHAFSVSGECRKGEAVTEITVLGSHGEEVTDEG